MFEPFVNAYEQSDECKNEEVLDYLGSAFIILYSRGSYAGSKRLEF